MNPSILSGYVYDLAGIGEQSGGSGEAGDNGGGGGGGHANGGSGIVIICNHRE